MKREHLLAWIGAIGTVSVGLLLLCTAGCQDTARAAVDPVVLARHRASLLLGEEPQNPQHVSVLAKELAEPQVITVIGKPGGVESPWEPGQARFTLADCSQDGKADHHHEGDHSDCPFCQAAREAANVWAVVEFQDESGKPIAIDARDLFEISGDSTVVVVGEAEKDEADVLTVRATGLYVQ